MDMSTAFSSAVEEHLPGVAIVFDHYHVSALMNKGIEIYEENSNPNLDEEGQKFSRAPGSCS